MGKPTSSRNAASAAPLERISGRRQPRPAPGRARASAGFEDLRGYLQARCDTGHSIPRIATELGVRDWQVHAALSRLAVRRTPAERAASDEGRRVQAVGWQTRRAARLAELGFADLTAYLRARHVAQGWSIKRMRAELGVGRRWLVGELARLGLRP
jgi:hypothetical protein